MPVGIHDSKEISGNLYSDDLKLGGKLDAWGLKSKFSGLPKNIAAALTASVLGNQIPLVSGSIESHGVETILRRLLGPYGLLEDIIKSRVPLSDLLRPLTSRQFEIMPRKIGEFFRRVNASHITQQQYHVLRTSL